MRAQEFITEVKVKSSWITDIRYIPFPEKSLIITLKNNKKYKIANVEPGIYQQFVTRPSKGKFWHQFIKGKYQVSRYLG